MQNSDQRSENRGFAAAAADALHRMSGWTRVRTRRRISVHTINNPVPRVLAIAISFMRFCPLTLAGCVRPGQLDRFGVVEAAVVDRQAAIFGLGEQIRETMVPQYLVR